jgi:hypothetical protein
VTHTRVLPDNGVVSGLAAFPVPDDCSFALVGDPDRSQIFRPQPARFHGFLDDVVRATPDLFWIVLDPSWLGIDLLVLTLSGADDASGTIEYYEARARRSLINGANVACHRWASSSDERRFALGSFHDVGTVAGCRENRARTSLNSEASQTAS